MSEIKDIQVLQPVVPIVKSKRDIDKRKYQKNDIKDKHKREKDEQDRKIDEYI